MPKPERCGKCGAEHEERKRCPRCGEAEWVLQHGAHYMQGAREVISCDCPALHSALGRRMEQARVRESTGKKPRGRPGKDHPVTTPEMAKKAAEALARGVPAARALREAGFPKSSCQHGLRGINRMVRAELKSLGRKYIEMGRDLTPEDQELIVRGKLLENVILGTDKGVQSAKQLGADKRVAMWTPDSQVGMVILQPPPVPKLDHPVPIIETRFTRELAEKASGGKDNEESPARSGEARRGVVRQY